MVFAVQEDMVFFPVLVPAVVDKFDNDCSDAHTRILLVFTNEYIALALTWYLELLLGSTCITPLF